MDFEIIPFLVYNSLFITATILSEILHKIFKIEALFTRKFAHASTGIIAVSFPFYIESQQTVAVISGLFLALLIVSKRKDFLHSINKISAVSYGSVLYPLAIYLSFLAYSFLKNDAVFIASILVLAVSDPLAAVSGTLLKRRRENIRTFGRDKKTLFGSSVFACSATIIIFLTLLLCVDIQVIDAFIVSVSGGFISSLAERISINGFDNLTIPLSLFLFLTVSLSVI